MTRYLKQFNQLTELRKHVVDYKEEIIPVRNQLAHARLLRNGDTMVFEGADGSPITPAQMKEIRCALLDYRATFKELLDALSNSSR